ncbi:MAG: AAA family ATPase [Pseudomonadales bacterium]|nr:AAA family ATPase [Pseudomonadales bacterium]
MKARLQRIEIKNFKAFRQFDLKLEGRHLLVYGSNGSGKSSLYWALYTFLQSARKKPNGVIAKYFEPTSSESLLNIHEDAATIPGEISLTLRDFFSRIDTTYRISKSDHSTFQQPVILKGELASDFITYRFFFGFSDFRNSEKFNIWPLFEKEILPFCVSTGGGNPLEIWERIKSGDPNPSNHSGYAGADAYLRFKRGAEQFAVILPNIVDSISREAQNFYDTHFSVGDPAPVNLKLAVTRPPSFSGTNRNNIEFKIPVVEFGIQIDGKTIHKPQTFLNEAKLTQLALSVRFAASLVNLHEADLKLLVLDDLLVSLDMSNRMKVVEILLSEQFVNYQKIILTHDLGLFREFRRKVGASGHDWCFYSLEGSSAQLITAKAVKTDIQKAEEYLHGYNLDEAALCLRKACEDTAKRFINHSEVIANKDFVSLTKALRVAREKILEGLPIQLYEKIVMETPDEYRHLLVASTDEDIEENTSLDASEKGKLKYKREGLRRLVNGEHVERFRQIKLIDDILACTERVLNPAAHSGNPPLYEKEVKDALNLIKQLESTLIS